MKKDNSKLIDKRFEKIIEDKAYQNIFASKLSEIYLKHSNILSKKSLEEYDEFTGFKKNKSINVLIWETDEVYEDKEILLTNVWVNEEYDGFPQIIPVADIETYCGRQNKYSFAELQSFIAKKGYRKYTKANPYIYHPTRIHFFKSLALASEWVAEDIHKKTKVYVDIDDVKSKISEIINTTEDSKTKRYKYKGYIAKKI